MIGDRKKFFEKILVTIFWIIIWQFATNKINQNIILPSPQKVLSELIHSFFQGLFWERVLFSYSRIMMGFFLAIFIGILSASLSYRFRIIRILLGPLVSVIRSVPTAAVIILFLIWTKVESLSIMVAVFMSFPIIYVNILKGMDEVDKNILEMAKVFRISPLRKVIYIYISQVAPYFESGGINALGIAWKSGIAAEVIGLPDNSVGEILYESKIYLNTESLFSWAVVIIILVFLSERIFMYIVKFIIWKIEGK